jgi:hypothetical protein
MVNGISGAAFARIGNYTKRIDNYELELKQLIEAEASRREQAAKLKQTRRIQRQIIQVWGRNNMQSWFDEETKLLQTPSTERKGD